MRRLASLVWPWTGGQAAGRSGLLLRQQSMQVKLPGQQSGITCIPSGVKSWVAGRYISWVLAWEVLWQSTLPTHIQKPFLN